MNYKYFGYLIAGKKELPYGSHHNFKSGADRNSERYKKKLKILPGEKLSIKAKGDQVVLTPLPIVLRWSQPGVKTQSLSQVIRNLKK